VKLFLCGDVMTGRGIDQIPVALLGALRAGLTKIKPRRRAWCVLRA
jgi:hypothetical protein